MTRQMESELILWCIAFNFENSNKPPPPPSKKKQKTKKTNPDSISVVILRSDTKQL
jgi:hypothetical protein